MRGHKELPMSSLPPGSNPGLCQLFPAALDGDFFAADTLLEEGVPYDAPDNEGWTPAGKAAAKGRNGVIQVMLDHGMDPSLAGEAGVTLLHVAAMTNKPLIVRQLLAAGADPKMRNAAGQTPEDCCPPAAGACRKVFESAKEGQLEALDTDSRYEETEQVFCQDRQGGWWPAIIKSVMPTAYVVHFPGFGKREDVTVPSSNLCKVTKDSVNRLRPAFEARLTAKSGPAGGSSKRASEDNTAAAAAAAAATPSDTDSGRVKRKAKMIQSPVVADTPGKRAGKRARLSPESALTKYDEIVDSLQAHRQVLQLLLLSPEYGAAATAAETPASRKEAVNLRKELTLKDATIAKLTRELDQAQKALASQNQADKVAKKVEAAKKKFDADTAQLHTVITALKADNAKLKGDCEAAQKAAARVETDKLQLQAQYERQQIDLDRKEKVISRLAAEKEQLISQQFAKP